MPSPLTRPLAKLKHQTGQLLAELRTWSPQCLRFRPSGEAWSALDVLEHLRLTEVAVLATMRRNLPDQNRVTLRDRLLSARILAVMLLPARVKVPAAVQSILPTATGRDLSALLRAWESDRTELAGFLESLSPVDQRQGVFRHPSAAGPPPTAHCCSFAPICNITATRSPGFGARYKVRDAARQPACNCNASFFRSSCASFRLTFSSGSRRKS